MNDLKSRLIPEDGSWLKQVYSSMEEALIVEDYFSAYWRERQKQGYEMQFYLEVVDVEFVSPENLERTSVLLGFSTRTLRIQIPDWDYTEEEKQQMRDSYQQKYVPVLKESQLRTNMLLWKTFSQEERAEILAVYSQRLAMERKIKNAIFSREGSGAE